jgi:hypothetical protein
VIIAAGFIVVLLGAIVASTVLGRQLRRELSVAANEQRAAQAAVRTEMTVHVETTDLAPTVTPSIQGEFEVPTLRSRGTRTPVIGLLAVPELLKSGYDQVQARPEVHWTLNVHPLGVDTFDDPDKLVRASEDYPLIETPIYAFFNAAASSPGSLRAIGPSFSVNEHGRRPFAFLARRAAQPISPDSVPTLAGRCFGVFGRCMSPTVTLLDALQHHGFATGLWEMDEWSTREPQHDRVDLLVTDSLEGQLHALKSGQVDYILVIYPHTHNDRVITWPETPRPELTAITETMADALSGALLNVLVTNQALYESDPRHQQKVEDTRDEVNRKNEVLNQMTWRGRALYDVGRSAALLVGAHVPDINEFNYFTQPEQIDRDAVRHMITTAERVGLIKTDARAEIEQAVGL